MAKFLSLSEVQKKLACGQKFLLARVNAGDLPAPVQLGPKKRVWIEAEIDQYIERQAAARPVPTLADTAGAMA